CATGRMPRSSSPRACAARCASCCSLRCPPMPTEKNKSPPTRVALVLGSGGARGLAHIGVVEAVERAGLQIVSIAGSSMGALVGGIYAAGRLQHYREWVVSLERSGVV